MPDTPTNPVLPAGVPEDWALDRDLFCPTCRYNLRMLHLPRCPECGLVFRWQMLLRVFCPRCEEPLFTTDDAECPRCKLHLDWPRLLQDARHQDRRLFEYGDQPVRAALRTWVRALNPWRFWHSVRLESPPVIHRLVWLRRVAVAVCLLGLGLVIWLRWSVSSPTSWTPELDIDALPLFAPVLILPLVTAISLPLFTPTLARFRIRRDQLLRCLAYASSGLFWIGVCYVAGYLAGLTINTFWPIATGPWGRAAPVPRVWPEPDVIVRLVGLSLWDVPHNALLVCFNAGLAGTVFFFSFLWWWAFLYVSLRRYLRLDRRNALALFISTQAIGVLLLLFPLLRVTSLATAIGILLWRLQRLLG